MSKAKLIGYNKAYIPNARADMRKRTLWLHNREYTDRHGTVLQARRDRKQVEEKRGG